MALLDEIVDVLGGRRVVALTGAGISTDSGIPDYRGPETLKRAREPIRYNHFRGDPARRRQYWARSAIGWPRLDAAQPNAAHAALVELERAGRVVGVITQNVDRLHYKAGSRRVVELHGCLAEVRCLGCGDISSRHELQVRLMAANPSLAQATGTTAPDGDVDLDARVARELVVPTCKICDGDLKPKVVFFGEGVPKQIVDDAWTLYGEAEVVLVLGSSLAVYSGYRFVRRAAEEGLPIIIINRGETRGDPVSTVRWDAPLSRALPKLAARLARASPPEDP